MTRRKNKNIYPGWGSDILVQKMCSQGKTCGFLSGNEIQSSHLSIPKEEIVKLKQSLKQQMREQRLLRAAARKVWWACSCIS